METEKPKSEPVQKTAQTDEKNSERKPDVSATLPVVNPPDADTEAPKPDASYDEADRKQDETLQSIAKQTEWEAKQTEWMEKQTYWVRLQAIFSVVLGVATLGVLVFHGVIMSRQSKSTEKSVAASIEQLAVMRKQVEITDRPWLAVDVAPVGPLVFIDGGVSLPVRFTVKNVGRSVATRAMIISELYIPKLEGEIDKIVIEQRKKLCEKLNLSFGTHTIFPNDTVMQDVTFNMNRQAVESVRFKYVDGDRVVSTDFLSIYIIGCVDYQFSDQSTHHQTGFIYEIKRLNPTIPGIPLGMSIGQDVPANELVLNKLRFGGDYAN
jgi:hypothetical protein